MYDNENSYENNSSNTPSFEASSPTQTQDFNAMEDVCHGVKFYWQYLLMSIVVNIAIPVICVLLLLFFPKLSLIIVFAGLILFSPDFIKDSIDFSNVSSSFRDNYSELLFLERMSQEDALQWSRFVFIVIYLAISAFYGLCLFIPIYKSMVKLYKTPESVCPNAQRVLNASWILFAISFCVTCFTINSIGSSYQDILWTTSFVLSFLSYIVFYGLLDKIGAKILPGSKECRIAIICFIISLALGVVQILFSNLLPGYISTLLSCSSLIAAGGSILIFIYVMKLQNSCSAILQNGMIPLPANPVPNPSLPTPPSLNDALEKLTHGFISKEYFVEWINQNYLPELKAKYNPALPKGYSEETIFRNNVTKERIEYCRLFQKAVDQNSQELLQQAIKCVYQVDLKAFKTENEKGWDRLTPLLPEDALILAVSIDDLEMAQWLVSIGVNVNYKNRDDKTPLQIAKDKNNQRMVEFLIINGAVDSDKK